MKQALFFRKCFDSNEYFYKSSKMSDFGNYLYFNIYKIIKLSDSAYNNFINNFMNDQSFISNNKDKLIMHDDDSVECLFITNNNYSGFLVYPSGYNYARYVAFYRKDDDSNV